MAPPTDGAKRRRWIAAGLASAFVVVVCVGGLIGLGGLVVLGTQVVRDEASTAVTNYLTAVKDADYAHAYTLLCAQLKARNSEDEFVHTKQNQARVTSFTVGQVEVSDAIRVPATINYANQTTEAVRFVMAQDQSTGAIEVCGVEG